MMRQAKEQFRNDEILIANFTMSMMAEPKNFPKHLFPWNSVSFFYKINEILDVEIRVWFVKRLIFSYMIDDKVRILIAAYIRLYF